MRPFEVDDISSADMAKVQTLTAEYRDHQKKSLRESSNDYNHMQDK